MDIVVLIKQVPDTYSERNLRTADGVLDRDAADAVIDEIDTRGVEAALQLTAAQGGEVTVLTMGPARAVEVLRKALAMGADKAIHISDEGLAGSCAMQTSATLAAALKTVPFDLVIAGNESTDGRTAAVPAMLAERLDLPQLTFVRSVTVDGRTLHAERVVEGGYSTLQATLPAVISVTEKINEPRYPNFKGIMAAKKKPMTTLTLSDLGIAPADAGLAHAWSAVVDATPKPPKEAGEKIVDDGTAGTRVAEFLASARLV
ncbi:MAG: electron transfer flavoprotein subunit beta/FixA family protein [Nakamurella sp.]